MQADNVGRGEQLIHGHIAAPEIRETRVVDRIACDEAAAEAGEDAGERQADPARPDDTDGLAVKVEAKQSVE